MNKLTNRDALRIAKKLGGWREGDMIRFPSPYLKDQFLAAVARQK